MGKLRHNVLLALGTIGGGEEAKAVVERMVSLLRTTWSGVEVTPTLVNPAIDAPDGSPDFTNQLVRFDTTDDYEEVLAKTKRIETVCGRDKENCKADVDILEHGGKRYHEKDWNRPYVIELLKKGFHIALVCLLLSANADCLAQRDNDSSVETFSKAIEYFGGQKYQEALLTFEKLEKTHRLSTRMQAYKGVCQYKTEQYEDAVKTLSPVARLMNNFSPHEQAVYYYAWGESNFQLGHYFESVPCFELAFNVSIESDKAEICYRLGFSQMMCAEYEDAIHWLTEAEKWYDKTEMDEITTAHREQAKRMLKALIAKTNKYKRSANE